MRIMRVVNDPKTTPAQLERVLCTDPAIVMKLLQVCVHRCSPVPAVAPRNGLCRRSSPASGVKKVGTAIIADKLVTDRLVRLEKPLEFSDYWIGTLLHDVGNLVLGFFFWDWMSRILEHRTEKGRLPPGGGRSG